MKILVIEVKRGEEVGYLAGTSCLNLNSVVASPLEATNYLVEPRSHSQTHKLLRHADNEYSPEATAKHDLQGLYLPGDAWFAKSAVQADSACMVEFEVAFTEVSRSAPRPPNGQ